MSFDIAAVRAALPDRRVVFFEEIDSTMNAAAGMPETGAVAIANVQTAGQGRQGHSWHSEPDAGLYFTVVLRPRVVPDLLPVVTLALGVAVQEAIAQVASVATDLRWPNDLLIGSRKCVGILTQLHTDRVLAGIGINVNHKTFPPALSHLAISLRQAAGKPQSREELLCAVLPGIDRVLGLLEEEGHGAILNLFSANSSYVRGRRVRIDGAGLPLTGTTAGLTPSGYLLVDGDDGRRHTILAGGVRPED